MQVNQEFEDKTLASVIRHIIPFVFLLYIVAFLDRVNLGYAAVSMNTDLGISAELFGFISGIFFIGYILFEIPSNLVLQRVGARIWIARIIISWGVLATLTGFVQNPTELIVLRFLLGIAEAGFFPGIIWYLSTWLPERHLARSISLFATAIVVSNIIGAPVSLSILDHIHWFSITGWRWLFILEGVPAIILGIATLLYLKNGPIDAGWLNKEQKIWLIEEIESGKKKNNASFTLSEILTDPGLLLCSGAYFSMTVGMYAIIFFLPTITISVLTTMNLTNIGAILSVSYGISLISMVLLSRHSDKTGERRYHSVLALLAGAAGLFIVYVSTSPVLTLSAITLVLCGIFSLIGPFWSFVLTILTKEKQATGVVFVNSVGNLGGFCGPVITGFFIGSSGSMNIGWIIIASLLCIGGAMILMARGSVEQ